MAVYFDPTKGAIVDPEQSLAAQQQQIQPPLGLDPIAERKWLAENQAVAQTKQFEQDAAEGRNKPFLAENPGQFFDDLGNILGDTATGLVTDYLDIGAGLADLAVQGASALSGNGWDWNQVFDDSDNPWTQWRQGEFGTNTEAGAAVANISRMASMLLSLPKVGIKGLALAPKALSKLPVAGKAAGGVAKALDGLDATLKTSRAPKVTEAMGDLAKGFAKGSGAQKAAKIAASDDWLRYTFRELSQAPEAKDWFTGVRRTVKGLGKDLGNLDAMTVGKALGWDAFAAFNVYGEGDWEMDETLSDMLGIGPFQTGIEDSPLQRKAKQMAEGLITGGLINAALDISRVFRYSQAFAKAAPAERGAILKAFDAEAEELGRGIAGLLPESAASLQPARTAALEKGARLNSLYSQVETQRIGNRYQNDLLTAQLRNQAVTNVGYDPQLQAQLTQGQGGLNPQQLMANQQMVAGSTELLPGTQPAGLLPEGQVQQLPGAPQPGLLPGGPQAQPGSMPAGTLGAGGELVPVTPDMQPVQVTDLGPRPPEPTVTPQTIRNAFKADAYDAFMRSQQLTFEEGPDGVMRSIDELRGTVKQLLPQTRVDAIEYMTKFTPQANQLGVINASDSVWMNFITDRGLREGWASIDPDTMQVRFNRKTALDIDRGDLAAKQAEAFDELAELNRYEEWLWNKELVNGSPQMRPEVQDNLAGKEARDAYDNWEAEQAAAKAMDPARADIERKAATAAVEEQQLNAAEEIRLSEAEIAKATGALDDQTVVREYLGTTLDSIQRPEVGKAEVGRGWEVYDANGEILGTTSTKKAADKLADAELVRLRDATIARARQMEADATDQTLNIAVGDPILDSEVVGRVTLTDRQIESVQKFSQAIQRQMNADWEKRTGGKAWININELGKGKKTFDLTQGEMYDLVDGIKALLQTGEIPSQRAKVLRNVADKLDTSMKLLAPQARAQRFANDIAADAQRFLEHGDFC